MPDIPVRRRFRASSVTIVISIALVLIMLGLLSVLVLKERDIARYVKENIKVTVFLNKDAKEVDIIALQKAIDAEPWRKSTEYVPKDSAAKRLERDLGEDFVSTLGYNPLLPSIEIYPRAAYADTTGIRNMISDIRSMSENYNIINDIYYQKDLVNVISRRMGSISLGILLFSGALLFIAVGLIFNTIRLSIYSQRFLIRTMDLVGATQAFIRRPFVWRGIINGIIGAMIAIVVTVLIVFALDKNFRELDLVNLADIRTLAILCTLQIALGIIITWLSTTMAVRKFLRQGTDALYSN